MARDNGHNEAPRDRNYRLGVLRRFLNRWDIRVPDLPFRLDSEDSISMMQIRPRDFMLDRTSREGQLFDPEIIRLVKKTIREQCLQVYIGIPTYYQREAFHTAQNVFEQLKPWSLEGHFKLIMSYQGTQPNPLSLWAQKNGVEVLYLNKFALIDSKTGSAVIGRTEGGKTQNYLKAGAFLLDRVKKAGKPLDDCLLVMVDDDYVMYSLETMLMLIIPWVLGKAQTESSRLSKLCRKYRNLRFIKNGSTRLDPANDELRQEVIAGKRPVLTYKHLILWCLDKDLAGCAQKLTGLASLNQQKFLIDLIGQNQEVIQELLNLDPALLLTPYNLEIVFGKQRAALINQSMNRWLRIGGRVTTVVTKELARRPYKLPGTLSEFTYLLHGDDAIEFSVLENLYLAPGYGLEISKMIQGVLATQKLNQKRPFKVANVINWPHIHIPNLDLPVLEMEMVIFFYLDFFISYIGLETLKYFQAKYEKNVEKVIRHKDGRIDMYPWHPRYLKGQYLVFPPLKELSMSKRSTPEEEMPS